MSRSDSFPVSGMSHGVKRMGMDIGRPAVEIVLDEANSDGDYVVSSVVDQFESYNWLPTLKGGRSYLLVRGPDALNEEYYNALDSFLDIVSARFTEILVDGNDRPPRLIYQQADSFVVDIGDTETVPDEMEYYSDKSSSYDSVTFVFDFEYPKKTQREVSKYTHENRIYDHATYIRVPSDIDDFAKKYEQAETVCRQNGWYLCPPSMEDVNRMGDVEDG